MPVAPIHEDGAGVYYEDTGAPESVDIYTTFVLVHGLSINSSIFRKTFPYAEQHRIRIVTMNLRDYFGSTPYSAEELLDISSGDVSTQVEAFRRWAREVASFLVFVAEQLGVSKINTSAAGSPSGGIILVPWSLSNANFLSMFGDPATLDENMRALLPLYLRKVIMNDPPCLIFGICPEGLKSPIIDLTLTSLERGRQFWPWVSAYYPAFPDTTSITVDALRDKSTALSDPRPSHESVPLADLASTVDPSVVARSGNILWVDPKIFYTNFRRTFLDAEVFLADMEVVALWCNQTCWFCQWGARKLADIRDEEPDAGKKKRKLTIVKADKANHFLHWERPEEFVQLLVDNA